MIKSMTAVYTPGARLGDTWIKLKPDHIDGLSENLEYVYPYNFEGHAHDTQKLDSDGWLLWEGKTIPSSGFVLDRSER